MGSDLPLSPTMFGDDQPWMSDPRIRDHRDIMVPDTIGWSGKRPASEPFRYKPIEFCTPNGWDLAMSCRDKPKGRLIEISSCSGLDTPLMPFADHAWSFLEIAEAAADQYIEGRVRISRADFARDICHEDSIAYLREYLIPLACELGLRRTTFDMPNSIGVTFPDVAGGDRLRIYHKGLETKKKRNHKRLLPQTENVIRVELQCRAGQLDDRQRQSVRALQTARADREPSEHDVPTMRLKLQPGKGVKRRHLWGMKRDRLPQRAVDATNAVNAFLRQHGFEGLLPESSGVTLPDPAYGLTVPHSAAC